MAFRKTILLVFGFSLLFCAVPGWAQLGNSGSIEGVVKDSSGGVVPNATVEIAYSVSGYRRQVTTGSDGAFRFTNVPFNTYHFVATASGFAAFVQDVDVRSAVPTTVQVGLNVAGSTTSITVEETGGDLVENESTFHTDVDRGLFDKLPLESASSGFSSLVTLVSPGAAADSNGLLHGLGDHAENSYSVDGQPFTDQFSKVFSNQLPTDAIQSLEVISGAPPAEFGDKTSLVVKVTTRSGLGVTTPTGGVTTSYGSFGTANVGFNLAYGGQNWGNFIGVNGLKSGRFLDPPEFTVLHDKGNLENVFDRFDYNLSQANSIHLNFQYSRSWFQTPNTFDNLNVLDASGNNVGNTDQRSKIGTFNIAPTWTRLISPNAVFTLGAFVRRDQYNYYPSNNPLADLGPINSETITQDRKLTNAGLRSDISYVKGIHNIKPTNTVLRVSYARTLETPFNENLIVATTGCNVDVIAALIPCVPANSPPGFRNEFHAGFQQAFGKYLVVDAEYLWKYTHNAYDFSILGNTPITFPIVWNNSKIPGFALRASVPNFHGLTALVVMSSVAARYFPPQVGGLGVTVGQSGSVFRIDHDEKFNSTVHLQYQPWKRGPWVGCNWRYDSGLVAGAVPDFATALTFDGDQQAAIGLFCAGPGGQRIFAFLTSPLSNDPASCGANPTGTGATRVKISASGTEKDDKNPPRIQPRHLFDVAVGDDILFHGDRYRWSARVTVINVTNKEALYNFLSTFSGTHFVSPRAVTGELGFHF